MYVFVFYLFTGKYDELAFLEILTYFQIISDGCVSVVGKLNKY